MNGTIEEVWQALEFRGVASAERLISAFDMVANDARREQSQRVEKLELQLSHLRTSLSLAGVSPEQAPAIPMRLHCPGCHELHIDEGEFATRPHHTHACQHCGNVWRPALVATVGVRFLPGFKDYRP